MTAIPDITPTPVQRIEPEGLAPKPGYSQVTRCEAGTLAFIAGQLPEDADGNVVGAGDVLRQAEQVFHNLGLALASVGAGWSDVVKFTLFMRNLADIAAFRSVRDRHIFPGRQPACTSVEVSRFHDDRFLIVLEAVARIPDHD